MENNAITCIILAGGRATRMGEQDKGLMMLAGKPMIEYVLEKIKPQINNIIINANKNHHIYEQYGYPIVTDQLPGNCGPLAGMASGLRASTTPFVVTVPCDSPLLPNDLVNKLYVTLKNEDAEICTVYCNQRLQPVFALMSIDLLSSMLGFLNDGKRKIGEWFRKHRLAIADFSDQADSFVNINTTEQLHTIALKLQ